MQGTAAGAALVQMPAGVAAVGAVGGAATLVDQGTTGKLNYGLGATAVLKDDDGDDVDIIDIEFC